MSWKKKLAVGLTLASATAGTIHLINKLIYFSSTLDNLLGNPSGSYYEWKFGGIYYNKHGEGNPILLIHDLTTYSSSSEWSKLVQLLSKTNTVYTLDLLGCGRSDKPNVTYTNFLYVQMITDFIKHVIGEKANVIATGESGSFVIAACRNDDTIINEITLINPKDIKQSSIIPGKKSRILTKLIQLPIIGTFLYNILTSRKSIQELFQRDYYFDHTKIDESMVSTYYESAHSGDASSKYLFSSIVGNYLTSNISHSLDSLNNSIFIFVGASKDENLEIANGYKNILPSIEIVELKNSKHLPQLEHATEFCEQIKIFFE